MFEKHADQQQPFTSALWLCQCASLASLIDSGSWTALGSEKCLDNYNSNLQLFKLFHDFPSRSLVLLTGSCVQVCSTLQQITEDLRFTVFKRIINTHCTFCSLEESIILEKRHHEFGKSNFQCKSREGFTLCLIASTASSNKNSAERRYTLNKETSAFHTASLTTHWSWMNIKAHQIAVNVALKHVIY